MPQLKASLKPVLCPLWRRVQSFALGPHSSPCSEHLDKWMKALGFTSGLCQHPLLREIPQTGFKIHCQAPDSVPWDCLTGMLITLAKSFMWKIRLCQRCFWKNLRACYLSEMCCRQLRLQGTLCAGRPFHSDPQGRTFPGVLAAKSRQ